MHLTLLPFLLTLSPLVASQPTVSRAVTLTKRDVGLVRRDGTVDTQVLDDEVLRIKNKYAAAGNYTLVRRDPSLSKRANVQSLSYNGDALWTGPISVGTPAQSFKVYYDTASSDLALAAASCIDASCNGKARYDYKKSTTAKATTFNVESNWVDGSVGHGLLVRDTVTIGSNKVTAQDVVAQQSIGSFVSTRNADGLGLAYPDASAARSASFPFTLMRQKTTAKTFSMRLSSVPGNSRVFFDGLDRTLTASAPTFFPVARDPDESFKTYWQIGQSTAFVGGARAYSGQVNFILDSGSSVIIAPPDAAAEFWAAVPNSKAEANGYYSYPCAQAMNVELKFGGSDTRFGIKSTDFNLGATQGDSSRCLGALVGQDLNLWDSWVIGTPFFTNWLLTFDISGARIGIITPSNA
ncbi:hypothetical protein JCM3765_003974 [Sporobolomyces pararoseus]